MSIHFTIIENSNFQKQINDQARYRIRRGKPGIESGPPSSKSNVLLTELFRL